MLAVLLLTFVALLRAFLSLLLPLPAVLLTLLSVAAAYGLLTLVVEHGAGAGLLGIEQSGAIEAWVPIVLFALLFGLSMDYQLFLLAAIRDLRSIGCKLALDDFGSGYSTYRFLNLFRPEYLKIEGTFVRGMLDHESNRKIVQHIHELATSFGIQTIAESVENEATLNALRRMGIAHAQGWHMGVAQFNGETTTAGVLPVG